MKNIAIIPARGGSKRIPRKNIKPFMGKPIIAYSIEAALQSGLFDEVMVSTDDDEIAEIARQYGANVPFMRSGETSNDYASTEDVIKEVLENYRINGIEFEHLCCIYATAPFVSVQKLHQGFELLKKSYNSVFTIVAYSYPVQRGLEVIENKVRLMFPEYRDARSQDLSSIYHDAGQFYIARVDSFFRANELWTDNTGGLILSELEVQDLDTETDWKLAEMKFQLLKNE